MKILKNILIGMMIFIFMVPSAFAEYENIAWKYKINCVFFARYVAKNEYDYNVPKGLTYLYQKRRIVNSQDPIVGDVMITTESYWGHLRIIKKVEGNYIYTVQSNNPRGKITYEWMTTDDNRIVGYYTPPIKSVSVTIDDYISNYIYIKTVTL